jgi:hypothetical protein
MISPIVFFDSFSVVISLGKPTKMMQFAMDDDVVLQLDTRTMKKQSFLNPSPD